MATATLTLFLGLLALTSTILSFNADARPQPRDEDLGTVIGPHQTSFDDEVGIVIGPHATVDDDEDMDMDMGTSVGPHTNLNDDDLGTIIGPEYEIHKQDFPEDFIFGTSVSAYQVNIHIYTLYSHNIITLIYRRVLYHFQIGLSFRLKVLKRVLEEA